MFLHKSLTRVDKQKEPIGYILTRVTL